jgi:hypothetical protein
MERKGFQSAIVEVNLMMIVVVRTIFIDFVCITDEEAPRTLLYLR